MEYDEQSKHHDSEPVKIIPADLILFFRHVVCYYGLRKRYRKPIIPLGIKLAMEFEDEIHIQLPREELWDLVSDPEALASCVPGAKEIEQLSETKYRGIIERGIAGISINLIGEVEMTKLNPPENLVALVEGQDPKTNSRMDATAEMSMEDNGDGSTTLTYHVDVEFTGRLATLGARIVKRKINSDIGLFFDNLRSRAES